MKSLLTEHQATLDGLTAERDDLTVAMSRQRESFKSQLTQLQDKLDNNLDGSSVATDDMSLDDSSAGIETVTLGTMGGSSIGCDSRQGGRKGKGDPSAVKKYKKRLRRVTKELTACHDQYETKSAEMTSLSRQLRLALVEVSTCHHKMDALREVNEGLRYHMQSCSQFLCGPGKGAQGGRDLRGDFDTFQEEVVIGHDKENMRVNALQHSPHFLQHSHHQSKMKSLQQHKLTGVRINVPRTMPVSNL